MGQRVEHRDRSVDVRREPAADVAHRYQVEAEVDLAGQVRFDHSVRQWADTAGSCPSAIRSQPQATASNGPSAYWAATNSTSDTSAGCAGLTDTAHSSADVDK